MHVVRFFNILNLNEVKKFSLFAEPCEQIIIHINQSTNQEKWPKFTFFSTFLSGKLGFKHDFFDMSFNYNC